jgi:hypothetical protein
VTARRLQNESAERYGRFGLDVSTPRAGCHSARVFPAGNGAVPAHAEVCTLSEPRCGVGPQGTQALLQVEGLCLRQVHSDRRATARHGRTGMEGTTYSKS